MIINKLEGLIAAPFTPMNLDGSLNLSIIPNYYNMLKANGVKGAFICGSTGEGVSLSTNEKKYVAEAWANCTKDDPDFIVMTLVGGNSIVDCIDLAKHAKAIGLNAISFTSPNYFKPATVQVLAEICEEIASAVPDLPFYYYHIPVLTGVNFLMINLLQSVKGRIPNFAGIKYTHEDFMDFLLCMQYSNGAYDMLWGRDENMLPALALGTKASVGSTFNYAAPLYYNLINSYQQGDVALATKLQMQSIEMIQLLGKYGGIGTGKAYMKLIGLDCGGFRLPVKNMTEQEFQKFKEATINIKFEDFSAKIPN